MNFSLKGLFREDNERSKKANVNSALMLILRGINLLISLLYVPLLINSLSSYKYGVWLTITSIIAWLNFFDIGLGNGLRNKLSVALAEKDDEKGRILISTSYFSIGVISIIFAIVFYLVSPFLNWVDILNVDISMSKEVTKTIYIVFTLFCVSFILNIINSILLAFQRPAFSSFIATVGQLLAFLMVMYAVKIKHIVSLPFLAFFMTSMPIIILIIFSIIFFHKHGNLKPNFKSIKLIYLKELLGLGIKFFIIQIITIVLFQTCNIIIAHKINQEAVTNYNIIYKYIGVIYMIYSIVVNPYWSASTEAYAKGDLEWIKKSMKKLNLIRYLFIIVGFLLVLISPIILKLWIGKDLGIEYLTVFLGFIYFVLLMKYNANAFILNGIGKIYIQMIFTSVLALIFVPLTILLAESFKLNGVYISLILTAFVNVVWSSVQYNKIINKSAKGIWNK